MSACQPITPQLTSIGYGLKVESKWYVVYTIARHEKAIAHNLSLKMVDHYLPLYHAIHRWKDRRAQVLLPLFPCYLFVRIPITEKLRVLEIPGVVRLVGYNGQAVAIAESEFERLRNVLDNHTAKPYPYLAPGKRVRLRGGALDGLEGTFLRSRRKLRAVVSVNWVEQSVIVDVDAADLCPLAA